MYRIRIDDNNVFVEDTLKQLEPYTSMVIVKHELPHGNPHYHIYVETELKEPTIRQRIKRRYPDLKPSDFSLKKCDIKRIDEYVQYMFNTKHGNKPTLVDKFNFSDEHLAGLMENAKKISDTFAEHQQKKRSKPTVFELAEEVDRCVATHSVVKYSFSSQEARFFTYVSQAIDVCIRFRQPFEEHYIRRLAFTAMGLSNKEYGQREWLTHNVVNKFLNK